MSTDNQEFQALKKLLALKKHEQPPPRYFEQMSGEVMARLRSDNQQRHSSQGEQGGRTTWLQRILGLFEARPALAGAFGILVCAVVISGVFSLQKADENLGGGASSLALGNGVQASGASLALTQSASSSTNPVLNGPSLFDQIGVGGQVKPVSLDFGGQ